MKKESIKCVITKGGLVKIKLLYPHEMDAYYTDVPGGSASVVVVSCAAGRFPTLFEEPNQRLSFQTQEIKPKSDHSDGPLSSFPSAPALAACLCLLRRGRAIALAVSVVVVVILIGSIGSIRLLEATLRRRGQGAGAGFPPSEEGSGWGAIGAMGSRRHHWVGCTSRVIRNRVRKRVAAGSIAGA